ncbi:hypothetical protein M514_04053, partial [Trichuris suis]
MVAITFLADRSALNLTGPADPLDPRFISRDDTVRKPGLICFNLR